MNIKSTILSLCLLTLTACSLKPQAQKSEIEIAQCDFLFKSESPKLKTECGDWQLNPEKLAEWEAQKVEAAKIDAELAEMKKLCTDLYNNGGTESEFLINQCGIVNISVNKRL